MKILVQGLVIASALVATPAMAQTVTYACQYVDNGGFRWKNGSWNLERFIKDQPFILTAVDGSLVPPDPSDATTSHPLFFAQCRPNIKAAVDLDENDELVFTKVQSCDNGRGAALLFNFDNLTGAVSSIHGAAGARNGSYKDSVNVAPFVCDKMR